MAKELDPLVLEALDREAAGDLLEHNQTVKVLKALSFAFWVMAGIAVVIAVLDGLPGAGPLMVGYAFAAVVSAAALSALAEMVSALRAVHRRVVWMTMQPRTAAVQDGIHGEKTE